MAEFALVAPIFFLLVFSVIQLGLVMAAQNGLVDGVRSAARRAATYRINEQSLQDTALMSSICSTIDQELRTRLGTRIIGYSGSSSDPRLPGRSPTSGRRIPVARTRSSSRTSALRTGTRCTCRSCRPSSTEPTGPPITS